MNQSGRFASFTSTKTAPITSKHLEGWESEKYGNSLIDKGKLSTFISSIFQLLSLFMCELS